MQTQHAKSLVDKRLVLQVNHEDASGAGELLAHGDQVELFESAWPASPRAARRMMDRANVPALGGGAPGAVGDLERQRRLLQRAFSSSASGELPPEPLSPTKPRERVPA